MNSLVISFQQNPYMELLFQMLYIYWLLSLIQIFDMLIKV